MGILTEEVQINPSGKSIEYYKNKGYDAKWHKPLMVKVEDLPLRSDAYIIVTCDYCGKEKPPIKYSDYNTQTKNGAKKCCCSDCAYIKREESMIERYGYGYAMQDFEKKKEIQQTNLKRYGCISPTGSEDVKNKIRETSMQKYGVEWPSQSSEVREKVKQTSLDKYGVECVLSSKEIQEKIKKTNLEKYGVENPFLCQKIVEKRKATLLTKYNTTIPLQNKECYEKLKKTNLEKYGVENVSQLDEIKNKKKETTFKNYGVEYSSQSDEVKKKTRETNLKKYGVESLLSLPEFHQYARQVDMERYGFYHHLQNPDILAKQKETFYKNGTCPTSRQQLYIYNLYNQSNEAKLNFPISYYNSDICFPEEKLTIEIDFGGHDLAVKLGSMTRKEFERKEIIRNSVIKNEGYRRMHIISSTDLLPSDEILLQMLEYAKQYFSDYPDHSWIEFDIDSSTIRNAEQKEGSYFNYGDLRRIKKSS